MEESWRGRPGRPPIHPGDPSVRMTLTLRGSSYQAIKRRSDARRESVPEFLRKVLDRTYGTPTRDAD